MNFLSRVLASSTLVVAASGSPFAVPEEVAVILDIYCYSCHDEDTQKGKLRLDQIGDHTLDARLNLLNKMQEQVFFKA